MNELTGAFMTVGLNTFTCSGEALKVGLYYPELSLALVFLSDDIISNIFYGVI